MLAPVSGGLSDLDKFVLDVPEEIGPPASGCQKIRDRRTAPVEIEPLHVAVDLPRCTTQHAAESGVVLPMQGADVGGGVGAAQDSRANVVNFPPIG